MMLASLQPTLFATYSSKLGRSMVPRVSRTSTSCETVCQEWNQVERFSDLKANHSKTQIA